MSRGLRRWSVSPRCLVLLQLGLYSFCRPVLPPPPHSRHDGSAWSNAMCGSPTLKKGTFFYANRLSTPVWGCTADHTVQQMLSSKSFLLQQQTIAVLFANNWSGEPTLFGNNGPTPITRSPQRITIICSAHLLLQMVTCATIIYRGPCKYLPCGLRVEFWYVDCNGCEMENNLGVFKRSFKRLCRFSVANSLDLVFGVWSSQNVQNNQTYLLSYC